MDKNDTTRKLIRDYGYKITESPVSFGGPYDSKTGGWYVVAVHPADGRISSEKGYLSQALEDILDRIQKALKKSDEKWDVLLAATPDCVWEQWTKEVKHDTRLKEYHKFCRKIEECIEPRSPGQSIDKIDHDACNAAITLLKIVFDNELPIPIKCCHEIFGAISLNWQVNDYTNHDLYISLLVTVLNDGTMTYKYYQEKPVKVYEPESDISVPHLLSILSGMYNEEK